jgi:hypothetical protein
MEEELIHEYSVAQYFIDGSYDYECRYVPVQAAIKAFNRLRNSVGGRIGTTQRVIITDGGDCINMEWEYGKGITYPEDLKGK